MDIKDISTKNFVFEPTDKELVARLEGISDYFKADLKVNKRKYFIYLCLMYDPQSEFRKTISILPQRKLMCALTAGFNLNPDNKFPQDVEDVLVGVDINAARMATELCMILSGVDFTVYTAYSRIFVELVSLSHQNTKKDTVLLISKVRSELEQAENKIFGGVEVESMRKSLYLSSKAISLNLQMEDIIERMEKGYDLAEFNPYPNNYIPQKLTYAGDEIPKE